MVSEISNSQILFIHIDIRKNKKYWQFKLILSILYTNTNINMEEEENIEYDNDINNTPHELGNGYQYYWFQK